MYIASARLFCGAVGVPAPLHDESKSNRIESNRIELNRIESNRISLFVFADGRAEVGFLPDLSAADAMTCNDMQ